MPKRGPAVCTVLLLTALLGGCRVDFWFSSDGDDDFCCADATGVWEGTVSAGGASFTATGLIIAGRLRVLSLDGGPVFDGPFSVSRDDLTADTTHYAADGAAVATGRVSATVSTRSRISGRYTTTDGGSGTLSLRYDPATGRGSSLSVTDANWFATDGSYSLSLAIDANGMINGADTDGCVYGGLLSLIDPTRNLYRIAVSASSCGAANGNYTGLATVTDGTRLNDTLLFSASNPNRVLFGALGRT